MLWLSTMAAAGTMREYLPCVQATGVVIRMHKTGPVGSIEPISYLTVANLRDTDREA